MHPNVVDVVIVCPNVVDVVIVHPNASNFNSLLMACEKSCFTKNLVNISLYLTLVILKSVGIYSTRLAQCDISMGVLVSKYFYCSILLM